MALNSLFCADVPLSNYSLTRKAGHRETCFIVRVEAQYKLIFAAGSII